ncbi:MAG: LacI family transcriptional regulator [Propionibacteriaceae bacterium]|jgi:LacI family transcriptional regulator|nr:LacI family transcriptional regulator [Propionibacteriaceae bacterium]
MITIKDIAREAGFSVSTVSRVVGGRRDVSPATAKSIQAVIDRHHFSVNRSARNLKRADTHTVLILVKGHSNMLFAAMIEHVQSEVRATGNSTVVQYLDEDENEVEAAERLVTDVKPSGVFFLGANADHFHSHAARIGTAFPAVVLTNSMEGLGKPAISSVSTDDALGARLAVEHLIACGHRQIGVIGGNPQLSTTSRLRLRGVTQALAAHRLPFAADSHYAATRYSLECGYRCAGQLLERCPELTAIYAMSDIMAIGALRALGDLGVGVPGQVSLVGHDGVELSGYTLPRLTTIVQPQLDLAASGTKILLRHIAGDGKPSYETVGASLREGESVRRA